MERFTHLRDSLKEDTSPCPKEFRQVRYMSSDDVINQIIRAIVQSSAAILKKEEGDETSPAAAPAGKDIIDVTQQSESEAIRKINDIFLAGIHSQIKAFQVTDTLAAFMIRAIVLNPEYKFNVEREMPRAEVDRLVKVSIA
jgi:hypothetical protein